MSARSTGLLTTGVILTALSLSCPASAHADTVAYLVNVTVRPGYEFHSAAEALTYGYGICDQVSGGHPYAQIVGEIKADFHTTDDYQASYLIAQAVNELCPANIWQLRRSAAQYRPTAP